MSDLDGFDDLTAATDPAAVIAVLHAGPRFRGCLVGFHCQTSIEPLHYGVWISRANHTADILDEANRCTVHVLARHDRPLARLFGAMSGDDVDKWELLDELGLQLPASSMSGPIVHLHDLASSDHVGVIFAPDSATAPVDHTPMTTLRVSDVSDLTAGHEVD